MTAASASSCGARITRSLHQAAKPSFKSDRVLLPRLLHAEDHSPSSQGLRPPVVAPAPTKPLFSRYHGECRFFSSSAKAVTGKQRASSNEQPRSQQDRYPGLPPGWEAVIGIECHAQITSTSKLFSTSTPPTLQADPNTCVSAFDAAHPGALPQLQQSAVHAALRAALFLKCSINPSSKFDRKHYFYPDQPLGYQITQKYSALAHNGRVRLRQADGYLPDQNSEVDVIVEQLQLEQDTAKSTHAVMGGSSGSKGTFVDLNRAGVGLMEIVSGPQMRTPWQAGAYVRKLQELLRRVNACDGNMEEGSLRCDINVSVRRVGEPLGIRCEVKNVRSIRFVMNAVSSEMHRQYKLLAEGQSIQQQTRAYDEATGGTVFLRGKEDAPDYRYMPDPNLPAIQVDQSALTAIAAALPEHPDTQRVRLQSTYGLSVRDVNVLMRIGLEEDVASPAKPGDAVRYFEEAASGRDAIVVANWVIHELLKAFNGAQLGFDTTTFPAKFLGELIDLVGLKKVTAASAKKLLQDAIMDPTLIPLSTTSKNSIHDVLSQRGLLAMSSNDDSLSSLCGEVIQALPSQVAALKKGDGKVINRLLGEVMKRSKGRADPMEARKTLLDLIERGG